MRDNNLKNIEDKGWASMKVMLEKEMPEKKRDRKIPFWYWFAGTAALLILGLFLGRSLYFQHDPTIVSNTTKVGEETQPDFTTSADVNNQHLNPVLNTNAPKELQNQQIINQNPSEVRTYTKSSLGFNDVIIPERIVNNDTPVTSNNTIVTVNKTNTVETGENDKELVDYSFRAPQRILKPLPVSDLSYFNSVREERILPAYTPLRKTNPAHFYIETDALVFGNSGPSFGFTVFAGIHKKLNRRIGIDLGLGISSNYYHLGNQFDFVNNLTDRENSDPTTSFDPNLEVNSNGNEDSDLLNKGYRINSSNYNSFIKSINELHMLHVPFGIVYKITPKNHIKAGIHYNYLFNTSLSPFKIEGVEYLFSTNAAKSFMNQHQFGSNLSYYRRINNRWAIDMKGILNITPLLKSELAFKDADRYATVSLGIRYDL